MNISEAADLIRIDKISGDRPQTWCDLGCGTGTFTLALATLLPAGSVIHAIDKDEKSLSQIPDRYQDVTIRKEVATLTGSNLPLPPLDGVLIANLLHYIEDQATLTARLRTLSQRLLVVEYDERARSQWIPYPIGFSALRALLLEQGFTEIVKIGTRVSRYAGELYSVWAESRPKESQNFDAPVRTVPRLLNRPPEQLGNALRNQ
ncbi:ubiquinone/menaquinone biosynthesis C-methylase UbiE [Silvibacterium bohemicum]|uniref:Ubiquinone/menaquinone biosynthesis C-methylase UbiE n=1 Tax=Silvibacterium bohemicum TaxID=1577686 RepID=A0A841JMG6_9BACT|nr:class I SAM-dependent methyltransferase [Silvibacterium bohemicum]MBB6142546.1 ubiquinone/menaquinone biosynthesis C-methylase UbiE [Silvibacterium bohemicum]